MVQNPIESPTSIPEAVVQVRTPVATPDSTPDVESTATGPTAVGRAPAATQVIMTPRMLREARRDSIARQHSLGVVSRDGVDMVDSTSGYRAVDSVMIDSVSRHLREFWDPGLCTDADAPKEIATLPPRENYHSGIAGIPRPELLGYNTGVMGLVLFTFLWISLTFQHHTTFLKTFAQDLWSVRKRSNVFEDHTVNETRILASLIMLVCVCEGILLFCMFRPAGIAGGMFGAVGLMISLAAGYYLWQLLAYMVTGYAFTDAVMSTQWVKGFNASQALLGLALTPPSLWVVFHPEAVSWVIPLSILLYGIARIIFICKGFRIFYDKFSSLVYFILYLCTLEIVPLILIIRVCRFL